MRRRGFLGAAAAGWADASRRRRRRSLYRRRLPIPRVIDGDAGDVTITIRQANVQALPGRETRMWTYDGSFPGPTIRKTSGSPLKVTFEHELPAAGRLSTHFHGGHNTASEDGYPGGHVEADAPPKAYCDLTLEPKGSAEANAELISPGSSRTYEFPLTEHGAPERAAFQWYHDHRCDNTARNVYRGLAGMFILTDDFEANNGLDFPSGSRDIPLMLADRSFDRRNRLANPFKNPKPPPDDGVIGDKVLVNGTHRPYREVAARRYRLRILNASNFRSYNLSLTNGARMTLIATESGLIPKPKELTKLFVAPGERAEIIVDFRPARGENVVLKSSRRGASRSFVGGIMQFRVAGSAVTDTTTDPRSLGALRELPDWAKDIPADAPSTKDWVVNKTPFVPRVWTINGQPFDPDRVEHTVRLGELAVWTLKVSLGSDTPHVMHLHMTDWVMLRKNGVEIAPENRRLKETFFMDRGDEIVIAGKITDDPDYLGRYIIHCHMLDHEDHGLMSQFEVVEPAP